MQAMILAAGRGTRLRPLTDRVPKCMIELGGRPLLEYTLERLRRFGVTEVLVNLHHLPEAILGRVGDGARVGMRVVYSLEDRLLGTAGGVKRAAWFFRGTFLLLYGDNLSTCDYSRLMAFHRRAGGLATLALYRREDTSASGIAEVDSAGRITRFLEKPAPAESFSRWVNAGIYVLEPGLLKWIPSGGAPDFGGEVFPLLVGAGLPIYGYQMSREEGLWWIDTPEDLERLRRSWNQEMAA